MAATIKDMNVRDHIIECTEVLITKNGIDRTSLAQIATEADISRGTLFYYFPSKSDLIADISEKHIAEVTQNLIDLINNNPEKDLLEVAEFLIDLVLQDETRTYLHHHLLKEAFSGSAASAARIAKSYSVWLQIIKNELIKKMKKVGPVTDADVKRYEGVAEMIVAVLDGLIIQKSLGISKISARETAKNLMLFLTPEIHNA